MHCFETKLIDFVFSIFIIGFISHLLQNLKILEQLSKLPLLVWLFKIITTLLNL